MNVRERVLAVLPLEAGEDENHPIARLKVILRMKERKVKEVVWGLIADGFVEVAGDTSLVRVEVEPGVDTKANLR